LNVLPNNLPVQLSNFVGRGSELTELRDLLATTRLLSLTGAGGCGKTRLAVQVEADVLDGTPASISSATALGEGSPEAGTATSLASARP
jgi:hypothetical protein